MNTTRHFREQICDALDVAYDTPADEIVGRVKGLVPSKVSTTVDRTGGVCPARVSHGPESRLPHEPDDDPPGISMLEVCRHCRVVYRPRDNENVPSRMGSDRNMVRRGP